MQSNHRAQYPEIRKEEDELMLDSFLDTDKVYWVKQNKVEKFCASGSKTSRVSLKNHELVRGERKSGKCE